MGDLVDQAEDQVMRERLQHLGGISPQGFFDEQFIASVWKRDPVTLTIRQRDYVMKLCWKYRRQLPKRLTPDSDPGYDGVARPRKESRKESRKVVDRHLFKRTVKGQGTLL